MYLFLACPPPVYIPKVMKFLLVHKIWLRLEGKGSPAHQMEQSFGGQIVNLVGRARLQSQGDALLPHGHRGRQNQARDVQKELEATMGKEPRSCNVKGGGRAVGQRAETPAGQSTKHPRFQQAH